MTPNNIEELITAKGPGWDTYIQNARNVMPEKLLSDKSLIRLAMNADFPEELNTIIKSLYQDSKERPLGISGVDYFFKAVNYSIYSLKDWLKALHYFSSWLEKSNRQAPFLKIIGYLQCCEESPDNREISHSFIKLVEDMLDQHGFVG